MPEIDDGSAAEAPGRRLNSAWVTLTPGEAHELLEALSIWAQDPEDPGWHTHNLDDDGRELTIAVRPFDEEGGAG